MPINKLYLTWFQASIFDVMPDKLEMSYTHILDLGQARQGTQHCQQAVGFVGLCIQADPEKRSRFPGR